MAGGAVELAHRLDRALAGLGAGVAEEHGIGEAVGDQPLGQTLLLRDLVEVGDVPELAALLDQRLDQMGMAVAQRRDGDAAGEVEIAVAIGGVKIGPSPRSKARLARE